MIVTFPHMGDMSIALKTLFTGLGRQVLLPPPISKRTLELGMKYSPETACLPFKVNLGNFMEALEQGANTIITCGGVGPCRLGYYAEIQQSILKNLGFNFDMIVVEPNLVNIAKHLHRVAFKRNLWEVYLAFRLALAKIHAMDSIQQKVNIKRPWEISVGELDFIWRKSVNKIDAAEDLSTLKAVWHKTENELDGVKLKSGVRPLRIGVVGEFYVMLEPSINLNLDRRLGNMGVEVYKTMYLSDYINGHLFRKEDYLANFKYLAGLAHPYLSHYVGGHGLKSIAHTVNMGQQHYDGIIHMFPFTCMPEIVAKNILPKVSNDVDIPVLSLTFDEQSGEAGIVTRLEAFIDLLKYRRLKHNLA
jgi:predicted nucleotide-binding protein (sugar kinase/HSP70/actin superfamily)